MKVPQGFDKYHRLYVLKLRANFYGLRDAGLTWFEHLQKGLEARNLKQSKLDSCLFLKKNLIVIVHADDCLIFGCNKEVVNEFLTSLKKVKPSQKNPYEDGGFDFFNDRDL